MDLNDIASPPSSAFGGDDFFVQLRHLARAGPVIVKPI
jgi:hypothetical protein